MEKAINIGGFGIIITLIGVLYRSLLARIDKCQNQDVCKAKGAAIERTIQLEVQSIKDLTEEKERRMLSEFEHVKESLNSLKEDSNNVQKHLRTMQEKYSGNQQNRECRG
jgi:gas vesicle protein